ncbi:MAG TPA: phosphoribosylglycinamide formyltransferase [Dokdonella sp.]|uniref:phosphoribosylglycinamide formyltransferase n=1 Tax=Dokdonella sp. TaxID=2291710 RepID=UPI002D7FD1A7|nr:phosphoribosylglycinamide formyltransferase [Dokdonella sp.]HET9033338.1 phosphoribosylglycinamide formyltransferase [Dokdonella sp.]
MRVVVLASGRGSNLEALIEAQRCGELPIRIVGVLSDKATARALDLARNHDIAAIHIDPRTFADRAAFDAALFSRITELEPELIVLAGFMRILTPQAIQPWLGRIINIHPSLLPLYPGLHTHRRALEAGDSRHGASVHFVTAELDGGPVIARTVIDVLADDSEESLALRLLAKEHHLLCSCVGLIASGQIGWSDGAATSNDPALTLPLQIDDEF